MSEPIYTEVPPNVLNERLAKETLKRTANLQNGEIDLAIRVKEAREFLDWSLDHMKKDWLDWLEHSTDFLLKLRQNRMGTETEVKLLGAQIKDLHLLFSSPEHQALVSQLTQFVELMERLHRLKAEGLLDHFSELLLKLLP